MSSSDTVGEKRPFCVVPIRAIKDRRLKISHLRVLMALGYYANRAGVCWPSFKTLDDDTGIGQKDMAPLIRHLITTGMMRMLKANNYDQRRGAWGFSNRYQLLWNGDEPVPSHEEVKSANLLQALADRDQVEGSGKPGPVKWNAAIGACVAAYVRGIEAATAVNVHPHAALRVAAEMLVEAGISTHQVEATSFKVAREMALSGRGLPSLQQVSVSLI